MKVSKWDLVIIILLITAVILLIQHYFTGKSWEPIVAALIGVQAAIWRELAELKADVRSLRRGDKNDSR